MTRKVNHLPRKGAADKSFPPSKGTVAVAYPYPKFQTGHGKLGLLNSRTNNIKWEISLQTTPGNYPTHHRYQSGPWNQTEGRRSRPEFLFDKRLPVSSDALAVSETAPSAEACLLVVASRTIRLNESTSEQGSIILKQPS